MTSAAGTVGWQILEFIGGFIEYAFVPPFIGEWQQLTAERSVTQTRKQTHARLLNDIKSINKNIRNIDQQLSTLLDTMGSQETAMRTLGNTPTSREQQKTIMATYCVNRETVEKLREIVHIMSRIRSELLVRTTILQTARDSISLKASPDYIQDFTSATSMLLESETQSAQMIRIMYEEGIDADHWNTLVNKFIEHMGEYPVAAVAAAEAIGTTLSSQEKSSQ